MDLNWLLSVIVLLSTLSIVVRTRSDDRSQRSFRRLAMVLGALDVAGMFYAPGLGGYVVGALWALTILVPMLLMRAAQRAALGQQYARATNIASLVYVLHPSQALRGARDTVRAFREAQRGNLAESQRLLGPLAALPGSPGLRARLELMRLNQRWQEVYALGFEPGFDQYAALDPTLAALWLRSLGECGQRIQLVHEWPRFAPFLARPGLEFMLDTARLFLFAFTGRPDAVAEVLKQRLPLLPSDSRAFWQATALQAAGDARELVALVPELASAGEDVRRAVAYRAGRPALPSVVLPEEQAVLTAELAKLAEDVRHGATAQGLAINAPVTRGLMVLLLIVFGVEMARDGTTDIQVLEALGGLSARAVLDHGEWWRILSYQLLHFGFVHIAMNLLALNVLGREVERRLGGLRTAFVFFASGSFGGIMLVTLTWAGFMPEKLLVGASGGIMGFVGATIAIFLLAHKRERSERAKQQLQRALMLVALQSMLDLSIEEVSMLGHLSGVAGGFLVTLVLVYARPRRA